MAVLNPSTPALIPCSTGERLDVSIVSAREESEGERKDEAGGWCEAREAAAKARKQGRSGAWVTERNRERGG